MELWHLKSCKKKRGRRQQIIDDVAEEQKYDNMKRTAEDRTKWIGKRKQQTDVTCQEPQPATT